MANPVTLLRAEQTLQTGMKFSRAFGEKTVRKTLAFIVVVGIIAALGLSHATAGTAECRDAIDEYDSAKGDVADSLKKYADCVAGSDGQDDCDSEFSNLKNAQDDFESAVSEYQDDCN